MGIIRDSQAREQSGFFRFRDIRRLSIPVMPNSASAKKDLRQNQTRRMQNRMVRSALRTQLSKFRALVKAGDFAAAETQFRVVVRKLDQSAAKKIIHKNAADRSKSRLSHFLKKAKAGTAAA